ncbi:hypothetical protein [Rhodobacter capsulatus]|uniref:hypothetical protein n=1 Tax=Rhodobacter capsulatus TaxID=1061 RepID=UPI0040279950
MLRKELEDTISAKLVSLSNENAQRIAEEFVRIRYPDRFPYFAFRAFSPEGKSRPGWPDAALIRPDGRIDGVEATHTADRAGVSAHLLEYISKAAKLDPGKLASFIHVSVSPKVAFSPDEIADWTNKFVAAGFAPDTVKLLFGQTLVHDLCGPEFVRARIEILGIQDRPTHFRLYRSKIGPDEGRLGDFIPSWEDFDQGRVHRPAEAECVQARLDADGVALLRGIGASGKTVLAWLLAQDVMKKGLPAYSCDFADYPDMTPDVMNKLAEDLALFAHPEVLFVFDNIHLDETKAKELHQAWEDIVPTQRPRLLLVGRETRTAKGSAIANLKLETVALRARQAALGGVFRRLALRSHDRTTLPVPPEAVLTSWLGTFGGKPDLPETTADLIAFSAAVARRMPDLCRGRWTLQKDDAVEHVRMVYLDRLSPEERQNLSRLCVAERFELGINTETLAVPRAGLKSCNTQLGIVFRDEVGAQRQFVRYRLVHAALAELLIAAEEPVDENALMRDMACGHPLLGFILATRLLQAGLQPDAKALVETMTGSPSVIFAFDHFMYAQGLLRLINRLGIDLPVGFGEQLVATQQNRGRLVAMALKTPLGDLGSFLRYAESSLPAVFKALGAALAEEKNRAALAEIALRTSPEHLASFLGYAKTSLPAVFKVLAAALAEEKNRAALAEIALRTPLEHLASFLRYAETSLPTVFQALAAALAGEGNRKALAEIALRTPLDHLASFLRYAETSLPAVFQALGAALAEEEKLAQLAENMLDTNLDVFVGLLRNSQQQPLWSAAFRRLSLEKWTDSRMRGQLLNIDAFVGFESAVSELGRQEFAQAPARKIVLDCTSSDWQRSSSGLGLHHLAAILRAAAPMPEEQVGQFLDRVVDADWLDRCFAETRARSLAGNLFDLWHALANPDLYRRFDRLRLREKIRRELFWSREPQPRAEALSLWGAAALLGVVCDTGKVVWPDVEALGAILCLRDPGPERKSLDKLDIQLWLALRLMASQLERPIAISEEIGERILRLWQTTQPATAGDAHSPRLAEVSASMIDWLKACGEAGWTLVPPAPTL